MLFNRPFERLGCPVPPQFVGAGRFHLIISQPNDMRQMRKSMLVSCAKRTSRPEPSPNHLAKAITTVCFLCVFARKWVSDGFRIQVGRRLLHTWFDSSLKASPRITLPNSARQPSKKTPAATPSVSLQLDHCPQPLYSNGWKL